MKPANTDTERLAQRRTRMALLGGGAAVAALLFSVAASAQDMPNMGMFDNIASFYMEQAKAMQAVLEPYALRLFGVLAVISIGLFFIKQLLSGEAHLGSLVTKFTMEILKLGFFLYAAKNGPQLLMQLIGYFIQGGAAVTGEGNLSPSSIVVLGFDSCFRTFDAIGAMGWGDTAAFGLPLALAGMGILACFSLVGILYLVRVIELYLVTYGGVLLLGFGGISFTRDIPKNYLSYMLSAGAQLFMLNVVIGFGLRLVSHWPQSLTLDASPDQVLQQVLQLFVGSAVFAALAWSIPKVAASLVNGAVSLGAADAIAPAAAAGSAAAVGAAVATGGASTLAEATRGAMQAASSGVSLAKEQGSSGMGALLKGIGHAASAVGSEASQAAQAGMGLKPPSPHATDGRGRNVESLGTRAANNLQEQAQMEREAKAAKPSASEGGGAGASDPGNPGSTENQGEGLSIGSGKSAAVTPEIPASSSGESFTKGGSQSTGPRLAPPTLPPDTPPPSSVSIRIDLDD